MRPRCKRQPWQILGKRYRICDNAINTVRLRDRCRVYKVCVNVTILTYPTLFKFILFISWLSTKQFRESCRSVCQRLEESTQSMHWICCGCQVPYNHRNLYKTRSYLYSDFDAIFFLAYVFKTNFIEWKQFTF